MAYIYKITNCLNDKKYIGKTEQRNPENRWKEHLNEANRNRSSNRALYRAMKKYGIENFSFEVLEETSNPNEREKYFIQYYNTYHSGYNETLGGDGASYLILPEQDICKFYLETKSLSKTGEKFNCDKKTVDNILYKNNIPKFDISTVAKANANNKKPVAQLDKDTEEIIQVFESIKEAERQMGYSTGCITKVCSGKRKTTGGYKWKYL